MFALRNVRVGARLSAGFGLLLLLMCAILAVTFYGNRLRRVQFAQITEVNTVKQRILNEMLNVSNDMLLQRRLMLIKRGAGYQEDAAKIPALDEKYDALQHEFDKFSRDAEGDRSVAAIAAMRQRARVEMQTVDGLMRDSDFDEASSVMIQRMREPAENWKREIAQYLSHQEALTEASKTEYNQIEAWANQLSLVVGLISLVLGGLIAWLMTRSLTQPLAAAVRLTHGVAEGDLDQMVDRSGKDEVTELLETMVQMRDQVKAVVAAQMEMARQHEAGIISYRMDASRFPGEYGAMVLGANALVNGHIQTKMEMIALAQRYAIGDFSQDMPSLPGEKLVITETMNTIKRNLMAISSEINTLVG